MTLYLTDKTTPTDIKSAKASGFVFACKLYPAGATTNSEYGVTSMDIIKPVLECMAEENLPLLVHGEVTDPSVDVFDREAAYIETVLKPLIAAVPTLRIVMEHITTQEAAEFVASAPPTIFATITAHHLLYNRTDIFQGGINPHMYCLPILKREKHRQALIAAAVSGNPKFFIGTDSAPHALHTKETSCGCAGIFTGHATIELYAEAFESAGALDKLEGFTSIFGAQFYGLPLSCKTISLKKEAWTVPESYSFGSSVVRPLRAGQTIAWKVIDA
jgi:dihydroorotase